VERVLPPRAWWACGRSQRACVEGGWIGPHPVWFLDGNPIVGYSRLKGGVRLRFWSGRSFAHLGLTAEGSFKAADKRYVSPADIDRDQLRLWLAEARIVQWDYWNIMAPKGRLEWLGVPVRSSSRAGPCPST
jgi:hypothetical protein